MNIRLAIADIQTDSIVDGEGIRSVIWTQGCPHHCVGCHNPETHSYKKGVLVTIDEIKEKIDKLEGQDGITFSGGDPMEQAKECAEIAKYCKDRGLNIWCYTGYKYEELLKKNDLEVLEFLNYIDVLVDGKFRIEEKSYDALFRGSTNQRLIDVKKSLKEKEVILYEKEKKIVEKKKGRGHYMYV